MRYHTLPALKRFTSIIKSLTVLMLIKAIRIKNFKGIRDLNITNVGKVNVFIGKNNSGKSTVLEAISTFFSGSFFSGSGLVPPPYINHIDKEGNTAPHVRISLTFIIPDKFYDGLEQEGYPREEIQKLQADYGEEVQITRIRFEPNPSNDSSGDFVFTTRTKTEIAHRHAFEERVKKQLFSDYGIARAVQFFSSIDGLRANPNLSNYYQSLRGENSNPSNLRQNSQAIFHNWDYLNSGHQRHRGGKVYQFIKDFAPKGFANLKVWRDGVPMVEFGPEENLQTISFYSQGAGEIDTFEFLSIFNPELGDNLAKLYLIDEPENHKHISLQRKMLNLIAERSNQSQFFIATHSPTFTSRYYDNGFRVYLLTKNEDADTNHIKTIPDSGSTEDIKTELGFLNIDYFFYNYALFVEGESEFEAVPSILKFLGKTTEELGLKVMAVGGNDKINGDRLKETLELLADTSIKPFIVLDKENSAETNRTDILRTHSTLFSNPDLQYHLWSGKTFVNTLPEQIVCNSFNAMLNNKGDNSPTNVSEYTEWKRQNKDIENELKKIYYDRFSGNFSKTTFGRYIGQEIEKMEEAEEATYSSNEIFAHFQKLIAEFDHIDKQ